MVIGGMPLHVLQLEGGQSRLLCMKLDKPQQVDESIWTQALLTANAYTMMTDDWSYGLEDDGDAVLMMIMAAGSDDPQLLAARIDGMVTMNRSVLAGLTPSSETHGLDGEVAP